MKWVRLCIFSVSFLISIKVLICAESPESIDMQQNVKKIDYKNLINNPEAISLLPDNDQKDAKSRIEAYHETERRLKEIDNQKKELDEKSKTDRKERMYLLEQQENKEEGIRLKKAHEEKIRSENLEKIKIENSIRSQNVERRLQKHKEDKENLKDTYNTQQQIEDENYKENHTKPDRWKVAICGISVGIAVALFLGLYYGIFDQPPEISNTTLAV